MGAECHRCGRDIYDECDYCAVVDERDGLRAAAKAVIEAYMSGGDLKPSLAELERAAGFRQQGQDYTRRTT